jgi:hypothetical protein
LIQNSHRSRSRHTAGEDSNQSHIVADATTRAKKETEFPGIIGNPVCGGGGICLRERYAPAQNGAGDLPAPSASNQPENEFRVYRC